ncbi:MAG: hypothetical protein EOP51_02635 [Sphingobacteriales bacterium]|nr:MAG: hypothetical protein EOP51_02635 [Sphingobacteriales bacterium]
MIRLLSVVAVLSLILVACSKSNTAPEAPVISLLGIQPSTVRSGNPEDTLIISMMVSDANADLGVDENSGKHDVIMIDSRNTGTAEDTQRLFLPTIPDQIKEAGKGLSGRADIILPAALYLLSRDDHPDGDTLHFDIYIMDRAGHESNHIVTPDIYLTP